MLGSWRENTVSSGGQLLRLQASYCNVCVLTEVTKAMKELETIDKEWLKVQRRFFKLRRVQKFCAQAQEFVQLVPVRDKGEIVL